MGNYQNYEFLFEKIRSKIINYLQRTQRESEENQIIKEARIFNNLSLKIDIKSIYVNLNLQKKLIFLCAFFTKHVCKNAVLKIFYQNSEEKKDLRMPQKDKIYSK